MWETRTASCSAKRIVESAKAVNDGGVRPRDWMEKPDQFGRVPHAAWKPATTFLTAPELASRSSAFLQHQFSCQVAETLREYTSTIAALAETAGLNAGNLNHALRGRHTMSLAMMVGVVVALERVELLPAPSSLESLQPRPTTASGEHRKV